MVGALFLVLAFILFEIEQSFNSNQVTNVKRKDSELLIRMDTLRIFDLKIYFLHIYMKHSKRVSKVGRTRLFLRGP